MRTASFVTNTSIFALAAFGTAVSMHEVANAQPPCEPQWSSGFALPGVNGSVYALTTFDDGAGTALIVGGTFPQAGGWVASSIARWDGSDWASLGTGMNNRVSALSVFDDGDGPALYAAGSFTTAGGVASNRIARWDGTAWTPLGGGIGGPVLALAVFDDGSGPALFAGGNFTTADGMTANNIAKWVGSRSVTA